VTVSQVASSQIGDLPSGNFQKVRLDLLRRRRLQWGRALRIGWARGPSAATWENALGKRPLGIYLTSFLVSLHTLPSLTTGFLKS